MRQEIAELEFRLKRAINTVYLGKLYSAHWSTDFSWSQTVECLERVEKATLELPFKIQEMTDAELEALGFLKWDENSGNRIIPAYMHKKAVADGVMKETDDTDVRMGCFFAFVKGTDK